jgi:hypothetical protein
MRRLARVVLVLFIVAPAVAHAWRAGSMPLFVRMQGRVGPPSDATRGADDWQLQVDRKTYRFQLTHLAIMDARASSLEVVNALSPYTPQLRVYGPDNLVKPLTTATPSDQVSMLGYIVGRPGSAQLMVNSLDVTPPAPAATAPPAPPAGK